jgi:4-methyl-5(b-hydroxyethyl)-thiazole monophosphate biosynthesis
MRKVLVPIADGFEEMEGVIIIDTLRRAGWEVVVAGLKEGHVTASRGVKIIPDTTLAEVELNDFDIIVLPGGAVGTDKLINNDRILTAIRHFHEKGRILGAICAAPLVLQAAGILKGKKITCHPAVINRLKEGERLEETVVIDGNIITSQGPGTSFQFALSIIALIEGGEKADSLASSMIVQRKNIFIV